MTWVMPVELLPVAAAAALALVWPRLRAAAPTRRLPLEVAAVGVASAGACAAAWALSWWTGRRW